MTALSEFALKFRTAELAVKSYRDWVWSLRPVHCTLGASVLSVRREAIQLSQLSPEEFAGLAEVVKDVETRLKDAFAYDKINYLMLMMVDPLVHFHVVPRYATPRRFEGMEWVDKNWGKFPDISGPTLISEQAQALLRVLG
ncbi:MAG: HIT family protein [Proteobacteria bacterium]|nr:HIT family protein [Pseudomonadota bacterium]MBI3499001.1 HIT family protein [Pseudomonadota bacterium]